LITGRFGPAPPSCDRVHDHDVPVGLWAVAIARPTIRGWCGDAVGGWCAIRSWWCTVRGGCAITGSWCAVRGGCAVRGWCYDAIRWCAVSGSWFAVRGAIRGWFGDAVGGWCAIRGRFAISRRSGLARRFGLDRWFGFMGRGRLPVIIRPSSSASNSGSSNRAAVFAPMDSSANPSDARCREGPSYPGLSRVQRE
jgi:hypothetical protein